MYYIKAFVHSVLTTETVYGSAVDNPATLCAGTWSTCNRMDMDRTTGRLYMKIITGWWCTSFCAFPSSSHSVGIVCENNFYLNNLHENVVNNW